jgi:glycosyltransferase involved in cell wall biosynthesis
MSSICGFTMREPDTFRLSLIVPMFNEAAGLDDFFRHVLPVVSSQTLDYEIICIDDGSDDGTVGQLEAFHARDSRIKVLRLSRNFGKESALIAGLDHCTGDAVIPIDADLQDPPDVIPKLVEKWLEGYDMVLAVRKSRVSDGFFRRLTAAVFYRVAVRLSSTPLPNSAGDFRLLDRRVVDAMCLLRERSRFAKGLFGWLGFSQTSVFYERSARAAGNSKWRYWHLWNYALEGITSFSTLPLRVWTYAGAVATLVAVVYASSIIIRTLISGVDVPGYASLLVVMLFFGGLNMMGMGMIGEYIGRIFLEVKQRPLYLLQAKVGFDPDPDETVE